MTPSISKNFTEIKRKYAGEVKKYDCKLMQKKMGEVVILYRTPCPMKFLGLDFGTDSLSIGYFWVKRNYNVYHWKTQRGRTIMIYFNISRDTKIGSNSVEWTDMIVDVALKKGKGVPLVLDEGEIPVGMPEGDLRLIERTKKEILSSVNILRNQIEMKTDLLCGKLGLL